MTSGSKSACRRGARGQGMTENIVTVALIAIATIGIVTLYGDNVRNLFGMGSDALGGDERDNDGKKSTAGLTDKNLSTFGMQGGAGSGGNPGGNGADSSKGNSSSGGGSQGGSGNGGNPGMNSPTGT